MIDLGTDTIVCTFLIFCRIGGCMMLLPGIGSARVPGQIRLFLAIAVTLALSPLQVPVLKTELSANPEAMIALFIVSETAVGLAIGLIVRILFLAVSFAATTLANYIGFAGLPGIPLEDAEEVPAGATIVPMTATLLFFLGDQHVEVIRALLASYSAWPLKSGLDPNAGLSKLTTTLSETFLVAIQISSPFLLYGFAVNIAFGILNRIVPQVPIYFVSVPFTIAGGLLLLLHSSTEIFHHFEAALAALIQRG